MTTRWTPEELRLIADIVTEPNVDLGQTRLVESFGGPGGQTTSRLLEAAIAADTLRATGQLDLADGEVFMRAVEATTATTPARRDRLAGGLRRLQAHVGDCWRVGRLWIDPALVNLEASILEAAYQTAATWPLVLSCTPGRLYLDGEPWELARLRGRCALDVTLLGPTGRPVAVGSVVEVADHHDTEAWWHELVHASGVVDEDDACRLGALAARQA
jgi:hypothetical protein